MKLTRYTDYSLRVLLYLALHPDRDVAVSEISEAYAISEHHLAKAAKGLTRAGYLRARRGRRGGVRLARPPEEVRIGEVVRETEDLTLLECFDPAVDECRLTPSCSLKTALERAQASFLEVLDGYTLAALVDRRRPALLRLLPRAE